MEVDSRRIARWVILIVAAASILAVAGYLIASVATWPANPCNSNQTYPGLLIVVPCLLAFGLGHLAGHLRHRERASVVKEAEWIGKAVHVLITLLLLAGVIALAYETVGLANLGGLKPITSYVRCARSVSPGTTTLVAASIAFLIGHWFWYPVRHSKRDAD